MAIQLLTLYAGNVPLIGQTQIEFDNNTGNILTYLNSFGTDLNARTAEMNTSISTVNTLNTNVNNKHLDVVNKTVEATTARDEAVSAKNQIQDYVVPTDAVDSQTVRNAKDSLMNKANFIANGHTAEPKEYIETETPYTMIDPSTDSLVVDGNVVEVTDQNIVLPLAPFDPSSTDEVLDDSVNGLNTQMAHNKGDIVVAGAELTPSYTVLAITDATTIQLSSTFRREAVEYAITNVTDGITQVATQPSAIASTDSIVVTDSSLFAIGEVVSVTLKDDVYQAIQDTSPTVDTTWSLTNTAYWQVLPRVSRQDCVVHRVNKSTLAYDKYSFKGTKLFEDTADSIEIMNYYYGSADAKGLWSDATYWYLPLDCFERFNAGAYHPWFNELGTDKFDKFDNTNIILEWHDSSAYRPTTTYGCFGEYSTSVRGMIGTSSGRPNSEFYDKVYKNQSRDLRLKAYEEDDTTLLRNKASENESGRLDGVDGVVLFDGTKSSHCFKEITHTDVLGYVNLNEYAKSTALLYDLSTSDEGDDYTLDGILTTFKLSKKYDSVLKVLKSTDGGATWTALALTTGYTINYIANTITFVSAPLATHTILVHTQAKTNSTKSLPIGTTVATLDKVYASNSHSIYKGGTAVASGTGKIPTGNGSNGYESGYLGDVNLAEIKWEGKKSSDGTFSLLVGDIICVDVHTTDANYGDVYSRNTGGTTQDFSTWGEYTTNPYMQFEYNLFTTPSHQTIALDSEDSIASKRFYALEVDSNNQKQLVQYTKEVAYNSLTTSYDGDNELFDKLVDGTITDDNAKVCITSRTARKLNSFKGE